MNQHGSKHELQDVPRQMRAMRLHRTTAMGTGEPALIADRVPVPLPSAQQVLIRVSVCGVCHTELDEITGRARPPHLPVIPGHQVVGVVVAEGESCQGNLVGQRVGVAWIHSSCGQCQYCKSGLENLCPRFQACGMHHDGGYAEFVVAFEDYVYPIPAGIPSQQAAPLLCAGAVGYRSLAMADVGPGSSLGLTGFGSSGRLVLQMAKARHANLRVYVFARNPDERQLALQLGADWAGNTADSAPTLCEAVIDTTPAWKPVLEALRQLVPGGRLIINAFRKESGDRHLLAELDYGRHLWMEKSIRSVANVTRRDVRAMLELAANHEFSIEVEEYALEDAERALLAISTGQVRKSAVLNPRAGE